MQNIEVACTAAEAAQYTIHVGEGALARLKNTADQIGFSKVAAIVDSGAAAVWDAQLQSELSKFGAAFAGSIKFEGGESSKSLDGLSRAWKEFYKLGLDRKSLLINIGGGAIGDLGGLAAGTYMRGMAFINVPTTLLAQVDASVGGKLAVNFNEIKNLVGIFQQPRAVIADTAFLRTLPKRELHAGFAEVVKHGLIRDRAYFDKVLAGDAAKLEPVWLEEVVTGSCRIKAAVVAADEREDGLRKTLNFGHTLGHALEALSHAAGKPLLHGEAISLGMVAEARLAVQLAMLTQADLALIEQALTKFHLPVRLTLPLSENEIIEKTRGDKKNVGGVTKWSLLKGIGSCAFDVEASAEQVKESIRYLNG